MNQEKDDTLDNDKVRVGAAVGAAAALLAIQGALYHQVLNLKDLIGVNHTRLELMALSISHIREDVGELRSSMTEMVTYPLLETGVRDAMLRGGYIPETVIRDLIRREAPYMDDRAMLLQRLDALEAERKRKKAEQDGG